MCKDEFREHLVNPIKDRIFETTSFDWFLFLKLAGFFYLSASEVHFCLGFGLSVLGWPWRGLQSLRDSPSAWCVMEADVWLSGPTGLWLCERWCPSAPFRGPPRPSLDLHKRASLLYRSRLRQHSDRSALKPSYQAANQETVQLWPSPGCLVAHLLAGLDQTGLLQILWTPTAPSVDPTRHSHRSLQHTWCKFKHVIFPYFVLQVLQLLFVPLVFFIYSLFQLLLLLHKVYLSGEENTEMWNPSSPQFWHQP